MPPAKLPFQSVLQRFSWIYPCRQFQEVVTELQWCCVVGIMLFKRFVWVYLTEASGHAVCFSFTSFSLAVINTMIQCFPNLSRPNYMKTKLCKAVTVLRHVWDDLHNKSVLFFCNALLKSSVMNVTSRTWGKKIK